MFKKISTLLLLVLALTFTTMFFASCGETPPENPTPPPATPQDFTTIVFNDSTITYDGETHTLVATGVPEGANVLYTNAGPYINPGEYNITIKVTKDNYNDFEKTAKLKINATANFASRLINFVMKRPDAWSFMPEAFNKERLAVNTNPTLDFSQDFVPISTINQNFMGQQMYVLWEGVHSYEGMLSYFDSAYAIVETIATAYQSFISDSPTSSWTSEVLGFKVKIELDNYQTELLIGNNLFSLELSVNSQTNIYKGRIQISNNASASYEMTDTSLKINTSMMVSGVGKIKQINFVRNDDTVTGYFYEYLGAESIAKKTSAVISFNNTLAVVMSAKRESSDLLIEGYEEVYSSQTGKYLSGEVLENNLLKTYDTHWINLADVTGITNIKAVENGNELNPSKNQHDIYINNSSDIFEPEFNRVAFVKASRHYDIEMKTVYYIVAVIDGNDVNYEVVETQIPMLFIQEENIEDFVDEVMDNNSIITTTPTLPLDKIAIAQQCYDSLKTLLDTIKENLTYAELIDALGTRDPFFNS